MKSFLEMFEIEGWKKFTIAVVFTCGTLYKLDGMDMVYGMLAVLGSFGVADVGSKFARNKQEIPTA